MSDGFGMWEFVNSTAILGIFVNLTMIYYVLRYKQLRNLSIGGLLILSSINDLLLNCQSLTYFMWWIREAWNLQLSYTMCNFELLGEVSSG